MDSPTAPPPDPAAPRRRRAWLIAAGIALVLLAVYAGWTMWRNAQDPTGDVLTATVTRADLEDTITATGTLQPKQFVDVGTQVSGQLKQVLVEVGTVVTKGQLLAEIDPSVYLSKADADRAQLSNQAAQLNDRQAQLALAELQLKRQQAMMQDEATTVEALQMAEQGEKSARAQVASVRAQMQQTTSTLRGDEANLSYTKIYAPMAGTVVSLAVKPGQTLNANQQAPVVLRIADLSVMTVQAQVSEADVGKLATGMEVYFTTLGGGSRRYYSKLRQIPPTPTVLNNVVLYDALFDVANDRQVLMTQMTAQVFFVLASAKQVLQVPLTALHPASRPAGASAGAGARQPRGERGGDGTAGRGSESGDARVGQGGGARGAEGSGARGGARGGARSDDPRAQFRSGRAAVSVVDANGKISEREVEVGVMTRVAAEIVKGLAEGERVVIGTKQAPRPAAPKSGGPIAAPATTAPGGRR
jgi:macrolide-specific efflux system membrane fusion protein